MVYHSKVLLNIGKIADVFKKESHLNEKLLVCLPGKTLFVCLFVCGKETDRELNNVSGDCFFNLIWIAILVERPWIFSTLFAQSEISRTFWGFLVAIRCLLLSNQLVEYCMFNICLSILKVCPILSVQRFSDHKRKARLVIIMIIKKETKAEFYIIL